MCSSCFSCDLDGLTSYLAVGESSLVAVTAAKQPTAYTLILTLTMAMVVGSLDLDLFKVKYLLRIPRRLTGVYFEHSIRSSSKIRRTLDLSCIGCY